MGHTERIVAELATLDEAEKARLLAFVHELKAARMLSVQQQDVRAMLSAALAPYRWRLRAFDSAAKAPTPADRLRWQTGCSSTATCCYARSTPPRRPRR